MPTLHERLIGLNLDINSDEKISIHSLIGVFHEWQSGYLTDSEAFDMFDLTDDQRVSARNIEALYKASPEPLAFLRVLKDWAYLGEQNVDARYLDTTAFKTRLAQEVLAQGGTLP